MYLGSWLIQLWFISCIYSFSCYATAWAISRLASTSTAPLLLSFQGVALYSCCLHLLLATASILSAASWKTPLACPHRPHCSSPSDPHSIPIPPSSGLRLQSFCPSIIYPSFSILALPGLFINHSAHFLSCYLDHRLYLRCISLEFICILAAIALLYWFYL